MHDLPPRLPLRSCGIPIQSVDCQLYEGTNCMRELTPDHIRGMKCLHYLIVRARFLAYNKNSDEEARLLDELDFLSDLLQLNPFDGTAFRKGLISVAEKFPECAHVISIIEENEMPS